ncbi:hypothetical protein ACFQMJ_13630 [Cohnella cellulosilytica]|uniref:Nuclease-like protein n=2 Tax=Cohnella cellulosilytica TaxID=986710 RepID=A0ABW2F8M8_9BACL
MHITMSAVGWLNHGEGLFNIEDIADEFSRMVVRSLSLQKMIGVKFNSIYKEWENVLAFDKQAFQYGIEIINYYSKKVPDSNAPINPIKFGQLIATIRAIFHILHMRDIACDGILSDKKLFIDADGFLGVNHKIDHDSFSNSYVETLVNRRTSAVVDSIAVQFNKVCQTYVGVEFDDFPKLADLVIKSYTNSNEFLIGSISFFKMLIVDLLSISDENAERLLSVFLNEHDKIDFAISTADREYRLLRKCLILIRDDIIACPVSLFSYSSMAFYLDIIDNSLPDSPFKRDLFKITSQIHEQFETDIAQLLRETFEGAVIKNNIKKENEIPLLIGKGYVVLSGQIDVLAFIHGKLFVVECKDNPFKYNAKAVGNELNKFRKVSKGSYQYKLKNKIQDIIDNWESVMNYLGVTDPNTVAKHEPQGLFVIDSFSAAQLESDLPYPVITFADLSRFIQESIN